MPLLTNLYRTLKLFAGPATVSPLRHLPDSMVSEIRRLALTIGASKSITSVALMALETKSGSSAIASMLAFALVESGHDVIVFDASLSQSQHQLLNVQPEEKLSPAEPHVRLAKTAWPKLRLGVPVLAGEVGMKTALQHINFAGSVVVLDCPAMNSSSNALDFASAADGVVLVVQAGKTTRRSLTQCRAALDGAQIKIVGVLVNRAACPSGPNLF